MLRVTIELVPGGDESRKRTLLTGEIVNVTPENGLRVADYACEWAGKTEAAVTYLYGFERSHGALALTIAALSDPWVQATGCNQLVSNECRAQSPDQERGR